LAPTTIKGAGDWRLRQNQIPQRGGHHSADRSARFSSNIERTKGIRDSLKAGGDKYKIVADQTGNWMRSMRIVESVLPSLPKRPQVILSANDDMALGAIEALQRQGVKPGEILVTGFDAVPEALARVRDGWLAVTADQRPGLRCRRR
jgi:inositol transport system substrate-binding protein